MSTGALTDDGWAILALPMDGRRDLARRDIWERSLKRSRQRRARAATAKANLPTARKVGFAVAATALIAPLAQQTAQGQTTATAAQSTALLKKGSRGPGIVADGVFGRQTRAAVRAFQSRNGLMVDGVVGPQTRAALGGGAPTPTGSQ